jgi:hypothetical protein
VYFGVSSANKATIRLLISNGVSAVKKLMEMGAAFNFVLYFFLM